MASGFRFNGHEYGPCSDLSLWRCESESGNGLLGLLERIIRANLMKDDMPMMCVSEEEVLLTSWLQRPVTNRVM